MSKQRPDRPDPDAALPIDCGVGIPAPHVARIAKMYRAAAASREAIRALRLGETEPATIFVPVRGGTDANDA